MEIGTKIREILNTLEMKQSELSFKTGIDPGHLSKIVNNKVKPDTDTLERIAEALQVNIGVFYEEDISQKHLVESIIRELPPELIEFIMARPNAPYLFLAKDLKNSDLSPDDIRKVVELWKNMVEKGVK